MRAFLLPALLLALALAACGDGSTPTSDPIGPGTEPSWEGVRIEQRFASRGFGEVSQLRAGRFGPQGEAGLAIGGRSILATRADGSTSWRAEWSPDEEDGAFMGGLALGLQLLDPDGDGIDDVLAVNDYGEVHRFSGVDGSRLWSTEAVDAEIFRQTVLFGADAAPLLLPTGSRTVLDTADGAARFSLSLPATPVLATSARTSDTGSLLFLAIDHSTLPADAVDLYAFDATGEVVATAASRAFVLGVGAADLDGEGHDTLLAGLPEGVLLAFESDGTERFRLGFSLGDDADPAFTFVDRIVGVDLDDDGMQEIVFTLTEYRHPEKTVLVATTGAGQELWRMPLGDVASILQPSQDDDGLFVAVAQGEQAFGVPGQVAAVTIGLDGGSVRWEERFPWFVTDLAIGPDGAVEAGAMDGAVRRFDSRTGLAADRRVLGAFSTQAIAVSGDWTFEGDTAGEFTLHGADGGRLWTRRIELDGIGTSVNALALGDPSDPSWVAVGVSPYSGVDPGTVQGFDANGETRFVARYPKAPLAATGARAGGDLAAVVYAGEVPSSDCRLVAHSAKDGSVAWERALQPCVWVSVAAADVDGDGVDEIAVSGFSLDYPPFVALVGGDGTLRWVKRTAELPMWVATGSGLIVAGGADGTEGMVKAFSPDDGATLWTTRLPSIPDPADPRRRLEAHSAEGAVAPAPGGKASAGIAATTQDGRVFFVDTKGAIRWSRTVEAERAPSSSGRYVAGPLAIAPATAIEPSVILATQVTPYLIRTAALALSLDGEVKATFELEGSARGVAAGTGRDGRRVLGVATTLGATLFEAARE